MTLSPILETPRKLAYWVHCFACKAVYSEGGIGTRAPQLCRCGSWDIAVKLARA